MLERGVYAVAAVVLAVALIGLRNANRDVTHCGVTLEGGVPAVLWEPGVPRSCFGSGDAATAGDARAPVVVLAHGFGGRAEMMSSLARRLTRAGYAVVTFDFRGHGRSRERFARSGADARGLVEDVDRAVLFAAGHPRLDAERIAVAGHSMGAGAAMRWAALRGGAGAVIGLSGGAAIDRAAFPPPNLLLLWAAGDPDRARERLRALGAQLVGLEQLVLDRTYGDPARGGAVRLGEVEGVGHLTILYSQEAADRIVAWLDATVGPGVPARHGAGDGRFGAASVALLAGLVLLWGLPRALSPIFPHRALPAVNQPVRRLLELGAALAVAALLLAGGDAALGSGPLEPFPIVVSRELAGLWGLAGVLLCVHLARHHRIAVGRLADLRTWGAAALVAGLVYLVMGAALDPWFGSALPSHRAAAIPLYALLLLPFFGATEWMLRGPGATGVWLPIAGKALAVFVVALAAVAGVVSFVVVLALGVFAGWFALLEAIAYRLSRTLPDPWLAAIAQTLIAGWLLSASFPYVG